MNSAYASFSMRRPVSTIMAALTFLILGVIAWNRLPLKFLPNIESPFLICSIPYPGSTPEQVINEIAIPAEGVFRTIPRLKQIVTTSDSNGCSSMLTFDVDADMGTASAELRDRVERLKLLLPAQVDRVLIQRFNTSDLPIMVFGLFREGDLEDFTYLARKVFETRLGRVDGIAQIQIRSPIPEKEVLIEFDQDELRSMHLELSQLVMALEASSINVSAGKIQDSSRTCIVRTLGEFRNIEDIENIAVGAGGLRLKDVARVRFGAREEPIHVSLDGNPGLLVMVRAEQQANTVAACKAVQAELDRILKEPGFEGAKFKSFLNQAELITGAVTNLQEAGLTGAALAVLILLIFLHQMRPTLIVAFAIPASIVTALTFMYFAGMTLNLVTMVSLIIAVGMLVDDSIVVVENIIRHRQMGEDVKTSAMKGTAEITMAIVSSTTTTCVVFIPIIYMKAGTMSVFMSQLGVPLIVSLCGSLAVALTLIPLAMVHIHPSTGKSVNRLSHLAIGRTLVRLSERFHPVQRTINTYLAGMRLALQWRAASLLVLFLLCALTLAWPTKSLGMRKTPELDTREVDIEVELDQNLDKPMTEAIFRQLTDQLNGWRRELGIKNILNYHEVESGAIEAYLYDEKDERPAGVPMLTTEEAQRIVASRMPKRIPGAKLNCDVAHGGSSGAEAGLSVIVRGDDMNQLRQTAGQLTELIDQLPSVQDVRPDTNRQRMEIDLGIDASLAAKAGATPASIARTVDAALRGARLPNLKYSGREYPVWAQFREEDRKSKSNLDNVAVMGGLGGLVTLDQLVHYEKRPSPEAIRRINGKNVVTLRITASTENLSQVATDLATLLHQFQLPPGYTLEVGQQLEEMQEDMTSFISAFLMAIVLVYLVMSASFESLILPLSVLSTIPLSMAGAVWALFITNTNFDTVTLIGCVLMVGVIVRNGIVIVDHINGLRQQGMERLDALVEAGRHRFRPVVMTALTTILGLLPLAIAQSGGAVAFAGLGRAMVGGLTIGTILTLVVVPLFYSLLDDLRRWCADFLGGLVHRNPAQAPEVP